MVGTVDDLVPRYNRTVYYCTIDQVETYYENNESVGNDKDNESVGFYI